MAIIKKMFSFDKTNEKPRLDGRFGVMKNLVVGNLFSNLTTYYINK
jgi:hypothetical protein